MTCIQAEALEAATFPSDLAHRRSWHAQPNANGIAMEWERRRVGALWGDDPQATTRLQHGSFTGLCESQMQPAL